MALTRRRRRLLLLLVVLALLTGGAALARSELGVSWSIDSVRGFVGGLGFWGPLALILLLTFRIPLMLPSKLLLIASGICFGALWGTLYGALGVALSGILAFALTRWLGPEILTSSVPPRARRALRLAGSRGGAGLVGLATGYPVGPLTAIHVGAALTSMSFYAFVPALAAGAAVRAAICCWFGDVLVTGGPLQIGIGAVLLLSAGLPLLHPRVRGWLSSQFSDGVDAEAPPNFS